MPSGAAGIVEDAWIAEWISQNDLSSLGGRTQDAVTEYYSGLVSGSQAWGGEGGFLEIFFGAIMGGWNTLGEFIGKLVEAITGAVGGTLETIGNFLSDRWDDLTDLADWIGDRIAEIVQAITGAVGGTIASIGTFLSARWDELTNVGEKLRLLIAGFVEKISDFFDDVPVVGPGISDFIDGVAKMLNLTTDAQDTADNANKQIAIIQAQLAAGGTLIIDDFDRAVASNLGSNWEQWYTGPGAGTWGTDGKGNALWMDSGMDWRRAHARYTAQAMTLNSGSVSVVIKTIGEGSLLGSDIGYNWLYARMTADLANYIYAKWSITGVSIGYVLAGVDYPLGSQAITLRNGDSIEFQYGRGGNPRSFKLFVNNSLVLPVNDSLEASLMNTTTKHVGCSAMATGRFLGQSTPSSIQVFTAVDAE